MNRVLLAALALACACSPAMAAPAGLLIGDAYNLREPITVVAHEQPNTLAHALFAIVLGTVMLGALLAGVRLLRNISLVAFVALALGACNASDVSAITGMADTTSPTLPPSAVVSDVLATAGVSASGQAKVNANIATVQKAAIALCNIKPLAAGILNIGIALSPSLSTVAGSTIAQRVNGVATIACNALSSAPVYAALGRGQIVQGIAHLPNGIDVPVYGERM